MEECDCDQNGACMWSCDKAMKCRSRFMRDYADIVDEDDIDDEESEDETD